MKRYPSIPQHPFFIFTLLISTGLLVMLSQSAIFHKNPEILSYGITFDLLLTLPLLCVMAIRKTSIPHITIVPLLILCSVLGSHIIPLEHQDFLSLFKIWGLPAAELILLAFIGYKVRKATLTFKGHHYGSSDFYTTIKTTCKDMLPRFAVMPVATEIAVFYYGFVNWKKRPLREGEFSYHKNSGSLTLMVAFIMIVAVETVTLHHLLAKWSAIAAGIMTFLSIYSGIQLFGFMRSMPKRPMAVVGNHLYLRYGIMAEAVFHLADIDQVMRTSGDIESTKETPKLSVLGDLEAHNVVIFLKKEYSYSSLYGLKKRCKQIALFVDTPEEFINYIKGVGTR